MRMSYGNRQRKENAAAAKCHGKIRPKENLRILMKERNSTRKDDRSEDDCAHDVKLERRPESVKEAKDDVARDHRTDAER